MHKHLLFGLMFNVALVAGCSRLAEPDGNAITVDRAAAARLRMRFADPTASRALGRPQQPVLGASIDESALRRAVHRQAATAPRLLVRGAR